MLWMKHVLQVGILLGIGALCAQAQAVRLEGGVRAPRLSSRLNAERLTAAEIKLETDKINQEQLQAAAPQRNTGQARNAAREARAARERRLINKKKKEAVSGADD